MTPAHRARPSSFGREFCVSPTAYRAAYPPAAARARAQLRRARLVAPADSSCRATFEELKSRGVEFTEEPSERPYGIDAAFRDPSGNQVRMVQAT